MNKTVIFVTFAALAGLGLVGSIVLLIHRPDATATFTGLLITVLGLVVSAAGTFYALGKQGEKLERIQQQTNGNLSRRDEEITRLRGVLAEKGINPDEPSATGRHAIPDLA